MRLELLGGLQLLGDDGTPLQVQRRRLAVLAIVALAGRRGASRSRLLGLLWPDAPEPSARHALEQALSALRRQLHADLFTGTDPLALNRAVLDVDLWEFLDGLARADASALDRYRGPLLDGFHLDAPVEFAQWIDAERAALAERHLAALAAAAEQARAAGDLVRAARHWRAYQRAEPLSTRGALGLIDALHATRDAAGLRRFARAYDALVRSELGTAPDATVQAALEHPATPSPVRAAVPTAEREPPPLPPPSPHPSPRGLDGPPRRVTPRRAMLLVLPAAAALTVFGVRFGRARPAPPLAEAAATVILPFRVADSSSTFAYLGEAMVDLLAMKFAGSGVVPVVSPATTLETWRASGLRAEGVMGAPHVQVARRLHATQVVTGSIVESGDALTLGATLADARSGRTVAGIEVRGPRDSVSVLVDRLAARLLLVATAEEPADLPDLGTTPMAALRAYVAGQAAAREGRLEDAIRAFRQALDRDSTFALAALRLADVAGWVGPSWTWNTPEIEREALRLAWRHRDRLSSRDRAMLLADAGPDYPAPSSEAQHLDAWSRAVMLAPERADIWLGFGDHLFHSGPLLGRPDAHRRAREAFARAAALDSGRVAALGHLVDLAALAGDTAEVRRAAGAYLRLSPGADLADLVRWRAGVALGDTAALRALRARWDRMPLESLMRVAVAMQMDGLQLDDLDGIARVLARRLYEASDPQRVHEILVDIELNRGRPAASAARKRAWRERRSPEQVAARLAGDALLAGGDRAGAAAALDALGPPERLGPGALCAWGLLRAEPAPAAARRSAARLEAIAAIRPPVDSEGVGSKSAICALHLRAMLAAPGAARLATLRRLDSAMRDGPSVFDVTMSGGENLWLAGAWMREGRPAESLAAARRRAYGGLWPTRFLADALRDEGFAAAALGDTAAARRAWRHYLALRSDPEPALAGERAVVLAALEGR